LTQLVSIVIILWWAVISSKSVHYWCFSCNRGAQGFVIVVDLSRSSTLGHVKQWVDQIFQTSDIRDPTIMVLANKKDVEKKQITN